MTRSKWRGPFLNIKTIKNKKATASRNSSIAPSCVGLTYDVYNGKTYIEVTVTESMVGHKFGEFSFTRAKYVYKKKKLKK